MMADDYDPIPSPDDVHARFAAWFDHAHHHKPHVMSTDGLVEELGACAGCGRPVRVCDGGLRDDRGLWHLTCARGGNR